MKISFASLAAPPSGALIVTALAGATLGAFGREIDLRTGGQLSRAIKASRFRGNKGQWLEIVAPAGIVAARVLIAGLGKADQVNRLAYEAIGGEGARRIAATGLTEATFAVEPFADLAVPPAEAAARIGYGVRLGTYSFDKYRTTRKEDELPSLQTVTVGLDQVDAARRIFAPLDRVAEGVLLTRLLVSEPGNVIHPESLAAQCRALVKYGVKVEVLGEAAMRKLGMGALLGVGQGSVRESQLVVMQWNGLPKAKAGSTKARAKKPAAPIVFVGKGVTFDTGGISLKPAAGMEEMKWDMGGAGAVIGVMRALAGRKARVHAVGVVGLVENMPDGNAQRPGDIVKSMSGQTIEVINTDAEGRLVLADALWYAQSRFQPQAMIDLATLTGACVMALGHENAGLFSNDDKLAEQLIATSAEVGEPVWRLPLSDAYDRGLNCDAADMANIAGPAVGAGAVVAAQFLQRFVNKTKWAHLDIAGVAWSKADKPTVPKGATGFGVRLLNRLVAKHFEAK